MSGYQPCACRDCAEIAIGSDEPGGAFCWECAESGCEPDSECQAPHTYCPGDERYHEDHGEHCAVCGQPF